MSEVGLRVPLYKKNVLTYLKGSSNFEEIEADQKLRWRDLVKDDNIWQETR